MLRFLGLRAYSVDEVRKDFDTIFSKFIKDLEQSGATDSYLRQKVNNYFIDIQNMSRLVEKIDKMEPDTEEYLQTLKELGKTFNLITSLSDPDLKEHLDRFILSLKFLNKTPRGVYINIKEKQLSDPYEMTYRSYKALLTAIANKTMMKKINLMKSLDAPNAKEKIEEITSYIEDSIEESSKKMMNILKVNPKRAMVLMSFTAAMFMITYTIPFVALRLDNLPDNGVPLGLAIKSTSTFLLLSIIAKWIFGVNKIARKI